MAAGVPGWRVGHLDPTRFSPWPGALVGGCTGTLDDLGDVLAARAAAAQRMMQSMSPGQRDELFRLSAQAFGSPDTTALLDELEAHLRALRPDEDWSGAVRFEGQDGLGLGDGTGVLQDLADLDQLAGQLSQSSAGSRLEDLDLEAVARQLGPEAVASARTLADIDRPLQDAGYLQRDAEGGLRLSPRAMRRLGKTLWQDAARRLARGQGLRRPDRVQPVTTGFRGDRLQLVALGRSAHTMDIGELASLPARHEQGTNLHHALLLARRFFEQHSSLQPVLLIVTDGEPTAHLLPNGIPWFSWPSDPETLRLTTIELDRLGWAGTQATFFRLGDDPGLEEFTQGMARRIGGRVVAPEAGDLGEAVLAAYLRTHRVGPGDGLRPLW